METQNFRSVSLRQLFDNAMAGRPINAHSVTLFDLADCDLDDDDKLIIDNDFGDVLDNLQDLRDYARYKQLEKTKNEKGGIENETPSQRSQDETPPTLPEK